MGQYYMYMKTYTVYCNTTFYPWDNSTCISKHIQSTIIPHCIHGAIVYINIHVKHFLQSNVTPQYTCGAIILNFVGPKTCTKKISTCIRKQSFQDFCEYGQTFYNKSRHCDAHEYVMWDYTSITV